MEKEGLSVVQSVYDRYNGKNRNPYAEIECGSNYSRGMASWSFIPIMSGFECDMVKKRIGFKPISDKKEFSSFWSCSDAWGTVSFCNNKAELRVIEGELALNELSVGTDIKRVLNGGEEIAFKEENGTVLFNALLVIKETLTVEFN
jgi:hypothetical protein